MVYDNMDVTLTVTLMQIYGKNTLCLQGSTSSLPYTEEY